MEGLACACWRYGERFVTDGAGVLLESSDRSEVVDMLDSLRSEVCDSEDCDLWPDGECGRGGGRKGGRLFMFVRGDACVLLASHAASGQSWIQTVKIPRAIQRALDRRKRVNRILLTPGISRTPKLIKMGRCVSGRD